MQRYQSDGYEAHISNLSTKATEDDLQCLFRKIGDIKRIFISSLNKSGVTYGFVCFGSVQELEKACNTCNGSLVHGVSIIVTVANSTASKIYRSSKSNTNNKGISKCFPQKERKHYISTKKDVDEIYVNLRKQVSFLDNNNNENKIVGKKTFMEDFKDMLSLMAKVPKAVAVDPEMFEGVPRDLKSLQNLIVRYHNNNISDEYQPFKVVDFDLTSRTV